MNQIDKETNEALNHLLSLSQHNRRGYRTAKESLDNDDLVALFDDMHQLHRAHAEELVEMVQKGGGEPHETGQLAGVLLRKWLQIKAALMRQEVAVLEEVAENEINLAEAYRDVLETCDLADPYRDQLKGQYEEIYASAQRIQSLTEIYENLNEE